MSSFFFKSYTVLLILVTSLLLAACEGQTTPTPIPVGTVAPSGGQPMAPSVPPSPKVPTPPTTLVVTPFPTLMPSPISPPEMSGALRVQTSLAIGTGVFERASYSDGLYGISEVELLNGYPIQRLRREEQPAGCDQAYFQATKVWVSGSPGMRLQVNNLEVGRITKAPPSGYQQSHGYAVDLVLNLGDIICASGYDHNGYQIIFGPAIWYHFDSYCFRNHCN